MIFPTKGYRVRLNGDVTLPVFDMQYYKITVSGEQFFPVSENITSALRAALVMQTAMETKSTLSLKTLLWVVNHRYEATGNHRLVKRY